jgi:hypothetical protein
MLFTRELVTSSKSYLEIEIDGFKIIGTVFIYNNFPVLVLTRREKWILDPDGSSVDPYRPCVDPDEFCVDPDGSCVDPDEFGVDPYGPCVDPRIYQEPFVPPLGLK